MPDGITLQSCDAHTQLVLCSLPSERMHRGFLLPPQAWTCGRWCWSRDSRGCAGLWGSELLRASQVVVAAVAVASFLELFFLAAPCVQVSFLCSECSTGFVFLYVSIVALLVLMLCGCVASSLVVAVVL
jgi:hypothetical protein